MPTAKTNLKQRAEAALRPIADGQLEASESAAMVTRFIKEEEKKILDRHRRGAGGLEIASARSALVDAVLRVVFEAAVSGQDGGGTDIALVAQGGYGRGHLNPGSDLDLLFLLPGASDQLPEEKNRLRLPLHRRMHLGSLERPAEQNRANGRPPDLRQPRALPCVHPTL